MISKHEAIEQVKSIAIQKILSREEVNEAYDTGLTQPESTQSHNVGMTEILYYIGGAIVALGICILLWQNWEHLSNTTKILTTFGSGIAAYVVGLIFGRNKKTIGVSTAFYLISGLVLPIGIAVIFDIANIAPTAGSMSVIALILFASYLTSFMVFRQTIFLLFSILFGTWLFFGFTNYLVQDNPVFGLSFFEYRVLFAALAYILLGNSFSKGPQQSLTGFLYGFGILGFLGSALALGGWSPDQNIFWEIIFPGLVFVIIFLGIHLKSKSFLTFGTIFLMVYILKITAEYFTTGLGWPLALVIAGLLLVAVGYLSFFLRKKYEIK